MTDLRQLIREAQREGRHEEEPDRSMEEIAAACCVTRNHLYDLMAGKPDPAKVKTWTIHRIAQGLDLDPEEVREAIKASRRKAQRRARSSLLDD